MVKHVLGIAAMVATLLAVGVVPAHAQGVGVRAGVSGEPDQFYFGGHVDMGPITEQLWFVPNVEIGVGHDVTLVTANIEFVDRIPLRRRSDWRIYFGGGPALVIADTERDTDSGGGFNLLIGIMHRRGLFSELKVGLADSPDIKFGVGYTFR
jgi:hypothetical protein